MSPIPAVEIDNFVCEEGETVRHLVGMLCTCVDSQGRPNPNCTDHDAGGYQYVGERQIVGLITDISSKKELLAAGVFIPGDCIFSPLTEEKIETMLRGLAEEKQLGLGKVAQPLRVAICGNTISPPIFDSVNMLGKESTLVRIDITLKKFDKK